MELILNKEIIRNKTANRFIGISVFAVLTALGAFVRIPLPFSPVPLTLQTFFVLLGGAILGRNQGALAQVFYVALGIAGLPVFSQAGSGLFYLSGPTTGYLAGFIVSSMFISKSLAHRRNSFAALAVFVLGDLLILGLGAIWLRVFLRCSFNQAMIAGVIPFIPGDLCKAALAFGIYRKIKNRCKEIF